MLMLQNSMHSCKVFWMNGDELNIDTKQANNSFVINQRSCAMLKTSPAFIEMQTLCKDSVEYKHCSRM
ncbi:unnamed protein product, partial [Cylicocyclus nassatus]